MAFKDITRVLYDGSIQLIYKDSVHRYYARERINWDLPVENPKAWGKVIKGVKGTTTLLKDTLEKGGLMNYALTKALMDLFAFYEFTDDFGQKKIGYSEKGIGRLWDENGKLKSLDKDEALDLISFGAKASIRHTKKGADIGSVVHDAIEHFVLANPNKLEPVEDKEGNPTSDLQLPAITPSGFDIPEQYMWNIKEAEYEEERLRDLALEEFEADTIKAKAAFERFANWWSKVRPELLGAEDLVYSKKYKVSGTFDALLKIDNKTVLCDWKTSNASLSISANAPNGVYYDYFIQSAIYTLAWQEMGNGTIDDIGIISCRKDGEFDVVFASDLGFTVDELVEYAKMVIGCHEHRIKLRSALWEHGIKTGRVTAKKGKK
ncbi:hypothetical protein EKK58_09370 [Candidatus Dependentiae bacterium]|nr:MAG: hypothetical protein EKK58_09370 [Candidatus Dependentiae bacterium]